MENRRSPASGCWFCVFTCRGASPSLKWEGFSAEGVCPAPVSWRGCQEQLPPWGLCSSPWCSAGSQLRAHLGLTLGSRGQGRDQQHCRCHLVPWVVVSGQVTGCPPGWFIGGSWEDINHGCCGVWAGKSSWADHVLTPALAVPSLLYSFLNLPCFLFPPVHPVLEKSLRSPKKCAYVPMKPHPGGSELFSIPAVCPGPKAVPSMPSSDHARSCPIPGHSQQLGHQQGWLFPAFQAVPATDSHWSDHTSVPGL